MLVRKTAAAILAEAFSVCVYLHKKSDPGHFLSPALLRLVLSENGRGGRGNQAGESQSCRVGVGEES